ncbi:MAG: bifunctional phosphoglucose/phosphomannose isomerase [Fidelibacterota bacterium]|nr:MAG: bifunctional phosphoglucose/phosphomannose isomerase [Candidatus Neomarinimicrobiota bacterium]
MSIKDQIKQQDKADMWSAVKGCPEQIKQIVGDYSDWTPQQPLMTPRKVLFVGMGGSAIGGDLVRVWAEKVAPVPMTVLRSYTVPHWVDDSTLVLASSYSGDTEETLAAVEQAADKGGRIVAVASGGQLAKLAAASGWDYIQIPGGLQPRAAIGYSLAATVMIMVKFQLFPTSVLEELDLGSQIMAAEGEQWGDPDRDGNEALEVATFIAKRLPIIYGSVATTEALAIRLRGQLAENSKLLASHHLLPEQNHNEIVGLAERINDIGDPIIIWLLDEEDHARVKLRQDLAGRLIGAREAAPSSSPWECSLAGSGTSLIQRNLSLLHRIDWVSYYTALLRGYDPSAIEILTRLKAEMKQS